MADAILRAILARPILSTVQDGRIPAELWNAAYEYDKARKSLAGESRSWNAYYWERDRYRVALEKFSDVLPEILKNLDSEND